MGSMGGDLEEQPQKHSQHAKSHIRLRQLRNCEVSSAGQKRSDTPTHDAPKKNVYKRASSSQADFYQTAQTAKKQKGQASVPPPAY